MVFGRSLEDHEITSGGGYDLHACKKKTCTNHSKTGLMIMMIHNS